MAEAAASGTSRHRWSIDLDLKAVAPFFALGLLLLVGGLTNPNVIGVGNLLNVLTRSAFIAITAIGATFVISAGGLDLSVGAMMAFVASLMIMFLNSGVIADPAVMLVVAMIIAVAVGAACGIVNGIINTVGHIEPSIAAVSIMRIFHKITNF